MLIIYYLNIRYHELETNSFEMILNSRRKKKINFHKVHKYATHRIFASFFFYFLSLEWNFFFSFHFSLLCTPLLLCLFIIWQISLMPFLFNFPSFFAAIFRCYLSRQRYELLRILHNQMIWKKNSLRCLQKEFSHFFSSFCILSLSPFVQFFSINIFDAKKREYTWQRKD